MSSLEDERLMQEALRLAEEGLAAGEQPIGAVVALDGEVLASARWRYRPGVLLDHAEVVALRAAERDARLRGRRREATLYTTLEPCLMCMGTAMSFLLGRVVYALEAPPDGAAEIAGVWEPDLGHPPAGYRVYAVPEVVGGVCRAEALAFAVAFAERNPELRWAQAFTPGFRYPDAPAPQVRIIAGSRKGARILAPRGRDTRPTADRVREAAFNLIGPVDGAIVLDLFAGSGAMGLEALSRGAEGAVFVESDREAVTAIERNLDKLALRGATVLRTDAARALVQETQAGRRYDLVLVDPPYGSFPRMQTTLATYLPAVLAPDGLLVVETGSKEEPELPLRLRTSRRYGAARLSLFEHE